MPAARSVPPNVTPSRDARTDTTLIDGAAPTMPKPL